MSRLRVLAADLRCLHERDGARLTATNLIGRALATAYHREDFLILVKDLMDIPRHFGALRLRVEELGPEHLPALARISRNRCRRRVIARFTGNVSAGRDGFVAFTEG